MMKLPGFSSDGLLPPGDYEMTLSQLRASMLVSGPGPSAPNWDRVWRAMLVDNLGVLASQLWQVGIGSIYVNGSFVEDKDRPGDIDGYFECDVREIATGELQRKLNLLDPHKVWTWDPHSRLPYRGSPKKQLPMWHIYRVELYPHYRGGLTGIRDRFGNELEFPSAFRISRRDNKAKGIVKLLEG